MTQNVALSLIRFIVIELIGDIAYFPIWWYSRGAKKFFLFFWSKIVVNQKRLGVGIWLTNLFTPMYGQADFQGKIISFFVRFFQIIIRSIILIVWTAILLVVFILWLLLPLIIAYQLYRILFFATGLTS